MYETLFYFVLALNIIKRTAESCIDDFFEIIKKRTITNTLCIRFLRLIIPTN